MTFTDTDVIAAGRDTAHARAGGRMRRLLLGGSAVWAASSTGSAEERR